MGTSQEFKILFDYMQKMHSRYLKTIAAFAIFDQLNNLAAPNKIGIGRAENNVKIFNNFKYFFQAIKESVRCYFLIELAKFFDKHPKSLTIEKVITYAEENLSKLTKKDFLNYHKRREFLPVKLKEYKKLSLSDLKKIKNKLNKNRTLTENIKTYRDQYLAHSDVEQEEIKLNYRETRILLNIVKSILELLYSKLDFSVNSYINFEAQPTKELNKLTEILIQYEQQRLVKIKEKWKI